MKILTIDDEPSLLDFFRAALSHKGFQVFTACNAAEALQILSVENVALVLLDVRMPEPNGYLLFEELKKVHTGPVLFVTGDRLAFAENARGPSQLIADGFTAGSASVLYKPFDLDTLCKKVAECIGLDSLPL